MTDYKVALFLHVTAAFALFGGSMMLHLALHKAREAGSVGEARLWAGVIRRVAPLMPVLTLLVVAPAVYLVHDVWGWTAGWIQVAAVSIGLTFLAGPLLLAPRMQALGRALGMAPDGPITADLATRLTDPAIWVTEQALTGAMIGEILLMSLKPSGPASVMMMAATVALAALAAVPLRRRHALVAAAPAAGD